MKWPSMVALYFVIQESNTPNMVRKRKYFLTNVTNLKFFTRKQIN